MRGHSRPKDGVASLAYDPRVHELARLTQALRKIFFAEAGSWTAGSSPAVTPLLLIHMGNSAVPSFNTEFTVQFE